MVSSRAGVERYVLAEQVVVGVSDTTPLVDPAEYDVLLTATPQPPRPWVCAPIDEIDRAVRASPAAAVGLVHVLRATETLPVPTGLTVESMAYSMLQHGETFAGWLRTRAPRERRTSTSADPVRLERSDGQLDVVLHRPEVHNALNAAMRDALCEAFDLVGADRTITTANLWGDGPSFCSGGDLDEFGTATDAGVAHLIRTERSVGRRVHQSANRVIAHLHGACMGAGIEIGAFAGRVVAAPDTTIGLPEVAMGLIPGAGGTVSVPRRIGRHRTAYLSLTGAQIGARTALAWGLVDALSVTR